MSRSPRLYPIFLRLDGWLALVVGGGSVAARKARSLLDAGARVRLVAPEISAEVRALLASQLTRGKLEVRERTFEPEDLQDVMLAIAATDDPATNLSVSEHAEGRRVLVNVVDAPDLCRFQSPSVVERGDLQIAISTHGKIPLLAQWIRRRLEVLFSPAWERYLERLAEARRRAAEARPDGFAERKRALEGLVNDETLDLLLDGREAEFQRRWEEWSSSLKV